MRFLDVALSSFVYVMDAEASPFGTDGYHMYFTSRELGGLYRQNRILANRGYLHMVLHCIFRHIWKSGVSAESAGGEERRQKECQEKDRQEKRYWDLSCDIAAEHIIDGCDLRPGAVLQKSAQERDIQETGTIRPCTQCGKDLQAAVRLESDRQRT